MQRDRILTYRLRGNRITEAQEAALFAHWQKYGLPNDLALNLDEIFPTYTTRIMEIGFGMGEATAILAKEFPETAFLAVEVHRPARTHADGARGAVGPGGRRGLSRRDEVPGDEGDAAGRETRGTRAQVVAARHGCNTSH